MNSVRGSRPGFFFFFFLFVHVAQAAKVSRACQQGAGKRLVFNLVRADSIAWNCGREVRPFVRLFVHSFVRSRFGFFGSSGSIVSLDRLLLSLSLFFLKFFLQGRFAPRPTSACTGGSRLIRIGIAFDRNSIKKWPTPPFRPKFPIFRATFLRTYGRALCNCSMLSW